MAVSFPLTLYIGLQTTSALNAAIYMSATPSMVLLINRLIFRDPVSARNWLGVIFSTLGVMILLFGETHCTPPRCIALPSAICGRWDRR